MTLDELDRKIILATQTGLEISAHPYLKTAQEVGISQETLLERLRAMKEKGIIRRLGLVPNHYTLGFKANGMSVWKIQPHAIDSVGRQFGELPFVSHCYERGTHGNYWDYNIFAMVHGRKREDVVTLIEQMHALVREVCEKYDVLYSEKILKKTGLRLRQE